MVENEKRCKECGAPTCYECGKHMTFYRGVLPEAVTRIHGASQEVYREMVCGCPIEEAE